MIYVLLLALQTDFYKIHITVVNSQEIRRDLTESWHDRVEIYPEDEDSRAAYYVVESLEDRRTHLLNTFRFSFINTGDFPGITINRVYNRLPDTYLETPHTYEILEYIESELTFKQRLSNITDENKRLEELWELSESDRKINFIFDLISNGKKIEPLFDHYYDIPNTIEVDGKETTLEKLGYKPRPKPSLLPAPTIKKAPFGFQLR